MVRRRDLHRPVERRAGGCVLRRRAARAGGRRPGRRSPAAGRTGPRGRSRTTTSGRAARRASGPGRTPAARARARSRPRSPATVSKAIPTRGTSVSASGTVIRSSIADAARRSGGSSARGGSTSPPPVRSSAVTTVASPSRSIEIRRRSRRSRPSVAPAAGHAADPVVVGRRAPQARLGRAGEERVDEPAFAVEEPRDVDAAGGRLREEAPAGAQRRSGPSPSRDRPPPTARRLRS